MADREIAVNRPCRDPLGATCYISFGLKIRLV